MYQYRKTTVLKHLIFDLYLPKNIYLRKNILCKIVTLQRKKSMAIMFENIYIVDCKDKAYIQRIAKYNSRVIITHMNDEECSQTIYGYQLPRVIAKRVADHKENVVEIRCSSANSGSSLGILPSLPLDFHKRTRALKYAMSIKEQKNISDVFPGLFEYVKCSTLDNGGRESLSLAQPFTDDINEHQALVMLDRIHPTGALHLPDEEAIIFEYNKDIFVLYYGENTCIYHGLHLLFNVDDGFSPSRTDSPHPIEDQLNELFIKWKENNYSDTFIPSFDCLDNRFVNEEKSTAHAFHQSSLFHQKAKRKHDSIDPDNMIETRTNDSKQIKKEKTNKQLSDFYDVVWGEPTETSKHPCKI